ncbi:YidC/Oxa1 family membrane protein insertase [Goodfellowiella coeruleoviolacea]|uniref:Membrane protein insertase YidC n=1 Tax=Goodfellowiella coeruleoviolacea TaxID=334858 RepID=A0AAE3KG16_9PSEU|nr:YidC/Oxa1 family membrane protein insertase [Goodfellowiella coeruleoviolacea]MCP2165004.1 YidC/Oxa1 family membrane protein insertase [Goodfellowiella coeruleoviolacea]
MFGFLDVPVSGAYHLVSWLASITRPLAGEFATTLAIVLFTAGVRLLLLPLSRAAVRGERARASLAPQLRELRERHRDDPQRLQQEVLALHQRSGTSLFAGCLPMLAQLPFFTVLYRLFSSSSIGAAPNGLLDHALFGAPLGAHWLDVLGAPSGFWPAGGAVFLGLFALLAVVAWCSSRWQARQALLAGTPAGPGVPAGWLVRVLPFGTLLGAAVLPLAAGVYLLTSTTWAVIERAVLRRGPVGAPAGQDSRS